MGLEFTIPCKVTVDATGAWQIKTPGGVVSFPTAGIDVGTGPTKGIKIDGNSIIKASGTVLELGNSAQWTSVELYDSEYPILSTMVDGVKYTFASSGAFNIGAVEAYVDIAAVAENTIELNLNKTYKLLACQIRVDEELHSDDIWKADYWDAVGGYGQAITANQSYLVNTKFKKQYNPFLNSPVPESTFFIKIRRQAGGNFTAQGRIRAIVYYQEIEDMDDI